MPPDRGLLLADQPPRGRDAADHGQHQPGVAVRHRPLPPRLLRRQGRPAPRNGWARSRARSSPTRRSATSGCASAAGSRPSSSPSPPTGPAASTSASSRPSRAAFQSYVIFIVRDDRACDFLFQCSDTTWKAYNRWPDQWSLYDDGKKRVVHGARTSRELRPALRQVLPGRRRPAVAGSGEFLLWEFPLAFWMEKEGYDVSYISNVDTHADGRGPAAGKALLSVGHDEYWSLEMYDNVKAAIGAGVNVGVPRAATPAGG